MENNRSESFTGEEQEILQELMNIAFGKAAADLADVIDIYVLLNVPNIKIIPVETIPDHIFKRIDTESDASIMMQPFWGEFKGAGLMVFPRGVGREMIAVLENDDSESFEMGPIASLEREVLMEIGNILVGACVGKITEMLDTYVTYSPPQIVHEDGDDYSLFTDAFESSQTAIVLETVFEFEKKNINGLLLIVTDQDSISWLKKALGEFMERYE